VPRATAEEIFEGVREDARKEIERALPALGFSGFAAGLSMGLSGLAVAAAFTAFHHGPWQDFVAFMLYPLGFVAVILGRAQLFTENTLYPVSLLLTERKREHLLKTIQLWIVVFCLNVVGALLFAWLAVRSGALDHATIAELVKLGEKAAQPSFGHVFWSGVIAGWLIALVAWLVEGSEDTIGQVVIIWMLTFVVGLAGLAHCIATSGEILAAVLRGHVDGGDYAAWLAAATLGNIAGGVVIVALLNYGQVFAGEEPEGAG
jgi:formate-nitrite transporter family protein